MGLQPIPRLTAAGAIISILCSLFHHHGYIRFQSLTVLKNRPITHPHIAKHMYRAIFLAVWSVLTVAGMVWGTQYDWPDFGHIDYGLPLVWGVHTLVTITGPADIWQVDLPIIVYDLVFWLALLVVGSELVGWAESRRKG
ncbi:MAG: hypothetical protein QW756_02175 [Nitrososphaerota archaeon]